LPRPLSTPARKTLRGPRRSARRRHPPQRLLSGGSAKVLPQAHQPTVRLGNRFSDSADRKPHLIFPSPSPSPFLFCCRSLRAATVLWSARRQPAGISRTLLVGGGAESERRGGPVHACQLRWRFHVGRLRVSQHATLASGWFWGHDGQWLGR